MHLSMSADIGGIAGVVARGLTISRTFDCEGARRDAATIACSAACMKAVARFRMALSGARKAIE